jgi:Zn-dependent membrane protease YugP
VWIIILSAIIALSVVPAVWVRAVMARHATDRADIPGTGGELARHLLDGMKLGHVKVEQTKLGDHYDPLEKAVRLSPGVFNGRSVTAVAVAAHEVGHAMQDATGYGPLRTRTALAKNALWIERAGLAIMLLAPLAATLTKSPIAMLMQIAGGALIMLLSVVVHLITLPVEFDASYRRALPVLEAGGFLAKEDMPAARQILRAAAFTYVAAALMSFINIAHWLRILRL